MKFLIALTALLVSYTASANVVVGECTFENYRLLEATVVAGLNDPSLLQQNVPGAAEELLEVLAQEVGPRCNAILVTGPQIPEQRSTMFEVIQNQTKFDVAMSHNRANGALRIVSVTKSSL